MKTKTEVEALKREWAADPIWDIEDTEGFEEYRDELIAFREKKEKEWKEQKEKELRQYAEKLGIQDNLELVYYIRSLERRIIYLEEKLGV